MEAELEDERKQRAIAVNARNKLQGDLQGLEQQVEMANKVKEDAVKQYKKLAAQMKDYQREVEEARIAREEMAAAVKDNEKRVSKDAKQELLFFKQTFSFTELVHHIYDNFNLNIEILKSKRVTEASDQKPVLL